MEVLKVLKVMEVIEVELVEVQTRLNTSGLNQSFLTLKEISRFSPPQMSMPASYWPSSLKYFLFIAKRPPAMVGDLRGGEEGVTSTGCSWSVSCSPDWSVEMALI